MSVGTTYAELLTGRSTEGTESADGGSTTRPLDADHLITRLSDEISWLEARLGQSADPAAVERLIRGAEHGVREVVERGADAELDRSELAGLEAVVHSDGSRPVLFVEDDSVDVTAPAAKRWAASLARIQGQIRAICQAVGRVNDPAALFGYQGTAWAVDDGVVVTNYHVLRAISTNPSRSEGRFTGALKPGVTIDFGAEIGGEPRNRAFPIRRVLGVGPAGAREHDHPTVPGINFDGLDLAVLELARVPGQRFPTPVEVARGDDPLTRGGLASRGRTVYLVGFPGNPWSTTPDVFSRLFAGVKGVKRLTPGVLTQGRGEVANDPRRWIIGHDASTLGGSSGSLVVDLAADGRKVLGLHFAGSPDRVNWAHGLEGATPQLAEAIPSW